MRRLFPALNSSVSMILRTWKRNLMTRYAPSPSKPFRAKAASFRSAKNFGNAHATLATRHDAALIADEIQCGLGRTGREFGYQKFPSLPDIVTVAKPLAGGLPLGAFSPARNLPPR